MGKVTLGFLKQWFQKKTSPGTSDLNVVSPVEFQNPVSLDGFGIEASTFEGVIITDENWKIKYVNSFVQGSSGLTPLLAFPDDLRSGFLSHFGYDPSWYKHDHKTVWTGVSPRCWAVEIVPLTAGKENLIRVGIIDVTEKESLKAEIQSYRKMSTQYQDGQEKDKESFHHLTDKMIQSIKPNVSRISGLTQLLSESITDPESRQVLEAIEQHTHNLEYSLRNLGHYKALKERKVPLKRDTFSIRECLDDVMDIFTFITAEKDLDISYWVEETIPDQLLGDAEKLQQVLVNLIDNAVRHTWEGDIILKVVAKPLKNKSHSPSKNLQLIFSIKDTGLGFPEELIETLCPPLSSDAFRHPLLGMGIPICHHLVQLMGGHLTFDSREGEGTECLFSMKFGLSTQTQVTYSADLTNLKERRILITDDNPINREILSHLVSSWNMEVLVTESAEAALELLQDQQVDLLISDMQMPGMNGVALAKEVKKEQDIPMILLSSIGSLEEYPDLDDLFISVMEKPVKPPRLLAAIQEGLGVERSFISHTPINTDELLLADEFPLNILVAEDNFINQKLILTVLRKMGYMPSLANNGLEAVSICRNNKVDLIFMDLQMPEMDGLEACQKIQGEHGEESPVIVALTAFAMKEDRERCLAAGMQEHISKPFRTEEIEQVIRTFTTTFSS